MLANTQTDMITYCYVINVHDAINLDIGFFDTQTIPGWMLGENCKATTTEYYYSIMDRETLVESEPIRNISFRVRLKGITDTVKKKNQQGKRGNRYRSASDGLSRGSYIVHSSAATATAAATVSYDTRKLRKSARSLVVKTCKDVGFFFICKIYKLDSYNRLLVDLYHPVTGESIVDKLFEKYEGSLYEVYQA